MLRTSITQQLLPAEETVRNYKRLAVVERAFRSLKSVDLKVRTIHHHLANRVRPPVLLCMLAAYVEWHMKQSLAPLLFTDEEPEAGKALRLSVVAPALRSPAALEKRQSHRRCDGLPVHSFHSLLQDLATLALNQVTAVGRTLQTISTPTRCNAAPLICSSSSPQYRCTQNRLRDFSYSIEYSHLLVSI